jgi:signal transduction histidine kinase/ActR/RegA family two-component response regulator
MTEFFTIYLSSACILIGAMVMFVSVLKTKKIIYMVENTRTEGNWKILWGLMIFFVLAYLIVMFVALSPFRQYLGLITGVVFLFGALFVFLVVSAGHGTVKVLGNAIDEKTKELTGALDTLQEQARETESVNDELTKSLRLNEEFIATTSHELRTPLNAILGSAEILQMGVYGELSEKQKNSIESIEISGRHLLKLLNDILDLSKMSAGQLVIATEQVDIRALCLEVFKAVSSQFLMKNQKASIFENEDAGVAELDRRRIEQILYNLIGNAVKFTPENGAIGIDFADFPEQQSFTLTVWDTGQGIPEELIETVRRPFAQIDGSLSKRHEGTGLGVTLVDRLANLHGGHLEIESVEGKGSRFTVHLPRGSADKKENGAMLKWQKPPAAEKPMSHAKEESLLSQEDSADLEQQNIKSEGAPFSVLLVDDHLLNLKHVVAYLTAKNIRVETASDGQMALTRAREMRPDVILLDIQMPDMDGLAVLRELRNDPATIDIKVIAATALAMAGDKERFLDFGANGYLAKPYGMADLEREIETVLSPELR